MVGGVGAAHEIAEHAEGRLMRIGIVTRRIGRNDGQGRVNMEVAREALRRGHAVRLFCEHADAEIIAAGAEMVSLKPPALLPSRLLRDQLFACRSTACLAGCDAVLGNGFSTWASTHVNAVHFVHRAWLASPHHPWRQHQDARSLYARLYAGANARLERGAFRRARKIVAVSQKLRADLLAGGVPDTRITTILNGVDTAEYTPGEANRAALGLPEAVDLALFAGDLRTSRKNLDTVLRALAHGPRSLHLAVAGRHEGTSWPSMAAALGLADRVTFLGFRTDMPALMRTADCFVFPSRYEACSLVLLEALASGTPVITAASAGGAEIVTPDAGIVLADSEDAAALAAALRTLLENAPRRAAMREAARKIAEQHGWQAMARKYLALLEAARHG
jgi:glycosyltransferase involved in cell wall biosynthesis